MEGGDCVVVCALHLMKDVGVGGVRLPGKGNSNSHGARPVHLIITMIKWIRTSRLSITYSFFGDVGRKVRG